MIGTTCRQVSYPQRPAQQPSAPATTRKPACVRLLDGSVIQHLGLFQGLEKRALDEIASIARPQHVKAGGLVFKQGDPSDHIFLVLTGRFKAMQVTSDGSQIVTRLAGPGDLMGHVNAFNGKPHPATPIAVVDSVVLSWTPPVFTELMLRFPSLAVAVVRNMGKSIEEAHARLQEASTERVERRIAHAVLRLARQAGRHIDGGVEITFPITRQDIALMTGVTLHTASRTLKAWEQRGIVNGGRQHLVLRDSQALVRIAKEAGA